MTVRTKPEFRRLPMAHPLTLQYPSIAYAHRMSTASLLRYLHAPPRFCAYACASTWPRLEFGTLIKAGPQQARVSTSAHGSPTHVAMPIHSLPACVRPHAFALTYLRACPRFHTPALLHPHASVPLRTYALLCPRACSTVNPPRALCAPALLRLPFSTLLCPRACSTVNPTRALCAPALLRLRLCAPPLLNPAYLRAFMPPRV